jgi:hypothetical protein
MIAQVGGRSARAQLRVAQVEALRGRFLSPWLAALDDFRNWLIREAA